MCRWLLKKMINQDGMSLVEIVLVIVIIGIAMVPLSRLSILNLKNGSKYMAMNKSMFYGQEIMENFIADYSSSDPLIGGYENVIANWQGTVTSPSPPTSGLFGYVTMSEEMTLDSVNYVEVTVTVSGSNTPDVDISTWIVK